MDKQTAIDLMQEILKLTTQLNVIATKVEESISGSDLLMMRQNVAHMMAACDQNLFRPILRKYPDLEPHY